MSLFTPDTPQGFHYRDEFVSVAEQASLIAAIAGVEFANFEMRGVVARRRVAFFGATYDDANAPARPMPEFLRPLVERAAAWAGVKPDDFAMALINDSGRIFRRGRHQRANAAQPRTTSCWLRAPRT